MNYRDELLCLFDGSIFTFTGTNNTEYRVCIEGIDETEATEEAFELDENGEPKFPLIYEALSVKNPELINLCSAAIRLSIQKDDSFETAGLMIISEDWWAKNSFHINELSISKDFQHIGLGTLLIKYLQEAAFIANKDAITLQCYKDDFESEDIYEARQRFYESLGFEPHFEILRQLMTYSVTGEVIYRKLKGKA